MDIVFGPVPSRRLGRSLGINNIPPRKICTYSCVYCQLGRTRKMRIRREAFYQPADVAARVSEKIEQAKKVGEGIDYLAFVPDGEPTLDIHLGATIDLLKSTGVPVAVISNASLIDDPQVQSDLARADWVSFKVDAVVEKVWRRIDRPHGSLHLESILAGVLSFRSRYKGTLVTETMLIQGLNDDAKSSEETAAFLEKLQPDRAYISIPTRPPAEKSVRAAAAGRVNRAFQVFSDRVPDVELLIGYEGNAFASSGDPRADILSITAVHPMREDAVDALLARAQAQQSVLAEMLEDQEIIVSDFNGKKFYLRKF